MHQQPSNQSSSNKARINLAIQALDRDAYLTENRAADIYQVNRMTLRQRRARMAIRRECTANSRKLTNLEEKVIINHIINLDSRGFTPTLSTIREIANILLSNHGK
jgi:hypothetical protein